MTKIDTLPPRVGLSTLSKSYDVILSDIWGVVHNGVTAWPEATGALRRFREEGGTVVLVSNAPRPNRDVKLQLDGLGVPREAWDDVVTSGDLTRREVLGRGPVRVHHLGPHKDDYLFERIERVGPEEADLVVATGLDDDDNETPEDYRGRIEALRARNLEMICANPDRVVEKGGQLIWCAGALADMYEELGGKVLHAGKPHVPIYQAALDRACELRGEAVPKERVMTVGDSVRTDLTGARSFGIDALFLTGGIHAGEIGDPPDPEKFSELLEGFAPVAWAYRLAWDL